MPTDDQRAGLTVTQQALGDYLRGVWPPLNAHDAAAEVACYAIAWFRSLPVEQRMEAMGMEPCVLNDDDVGFCGEHFDGKHWVEQ